MKPIFFGDSSRALFGVYHPPRWPAVRGARAVLLCYPGLHEYNVSHWAFRNLANMLSRAGLHVLRFDYFGTGDSAGETDEGRSATWVADVQTAARELRDLAQTRTVSFVGMRLGGALAARACAEGLAADTLVLWDPVVSGPEYVSELSRWDRHRNLLLLHASRARREPRELLGFRISSAIRSDIEATDLCMLQRPSARRMVMVSSEERPSDERFRRRVSGWGIPVAMHRVKEIRTMAEAVIGEEAYSGSEAISIIAHELSDEGTSVRAGEST